MAGFVLPRWVLSWWRRGASGSAPVRRPTVLLGLEMLEVRELLNAGFDGLDASPILADAVKLRNDAATSAITLMNAVQPSQANTPSSPVGNQWN